jgi:hypothetical protein
MPPDYNRLTNEVSEVEPEFQALLTKLIRLPDEDVNAQFAPRVIQLSGQVQCLRTWPPSGNGSRPSRRAGSGLRPLPSRSFWADRAGCGRRKPGEAVTIDRLPSEEFINHQCVTGGFFKRRQSAPNAAMTNPVRNTRRRYPWLPPVRECPNAPSLVVPAIPARSRRVVADGENEIEGRRARLRKLTPRLRAEAQRILIEPLQQLDGVRVDPALRLAAGAEGVEFRSAYLVQARRLRP